MRDGGGGASWYDTPTLYDIVNQRGSAQEARELDTLARRHARSDCYRRRRGQGASAPVWLEPACGSGRLLRAGARLGMRVIGIDCNPNMVRYARASLARGGLEGEVIEGRMESFRLRRRVDVAFCPHNSVRHLGSDRAMVGHLNAVADALKPGGIYVIGLGTADYGREFPSEDVWTGRRGRLRVTQVVQYLPSDPETRIERVVSVIHVERPRGCRCDEMAYDLRSYSRAEWLGVVRRSRLRMAAETDESGVPTDPGAGGYRVWVLGRKEDAGERASARRSS